MHVQRREGISSIALAGFLRSNCTETSKTYTEVLDNVKVYKCCLLNSLQCAGVEYVAPLANFEDVAFNR